jgi:hypothetical protein
MRTGRHQGAKSTKQLATKAPRHEELFEKILCAFVPWWPGPFVS